MNDRHQADDPGELDGARGADGAYPARLSRRFFMQSAGGATAALGAGCSSVTSVSAASGDPPAEEFASRTVRLQINGRSHALQLEPRTTLLDALRDHIGLVGTKKGCDRGQCGACTVLQNGRRVNACLTLAVMAEDSEITTIEGLGTPQAPHAMQLAFVQHDGFQCGYCTPGQICSAVGLLREIQAGDASAVTADVRVPPSQLGDDEIRERMSGNLCRCGAYPKIVAAVRQVAMTVLR
jgi:xanthine dehydrogenase YagT iron-sulfur-binding subunit